MSVLICDKERRPFSINFFLHFTAHTRSIFKLFKSMSLRNGSFLKPYNKLAVCVLSGIKHSCSFIIQYNKSKYLKTEMRYATTIKTNLYITLKILSNKRVSFKLTISFHIR